MHLNCINESIEQIEQKFKNYMQNNYDIDDIWTSIHKYKINFNIYTNYNFTKDDTNEINNFLQKIGWIIVTLSKWPNKLTLEQKTDAWGGMISPEYTPTFIPKNKIYHVTNLNNLNDIKHNGLIPKSTSKESKNVYFNYSKRVYLHSSIDDAIRMACQFSQWHNIMMMVLEINPALTKNKYYLDPEDDDDQFIFTNSVIPSKAITHLLNVEKEHADEIYLSVNPFKMAMRYVNKL